MQHISSHENGKAIKQPTIQKFDASMISPKELGMGVIVNYPASIPIGAAKSITFQATINGKDVTKTFDITQLEQKQMFDDKGVLLATTPLRINLATEGVPRFTNNAKFTVSAVASCEGGTPSNPKPCDVKVFLPVVVIHGYDYVSTKNNLVFRVFAYRIAYEDLCNDLKNLGYSDSDTYGKTKLPGYRTLWDPSDPVVQYGDVRDLTEAQILKMMDNVMQEVYEHSYANKANLVGHSFGGLIARDYAAKSPNCVNTVITVGAPHLGTTLFYESFLLEYINKDSALAEIPLDRILYWTVPTYDKAICDTYGNPLPNLFPNTLANVGKADGVNYFCFYLEDTSKQTTQTLIVQDWGSWYTFVDRSYGVGDGIIPTISAGSSQFGEPVPLGNRGSLSFYLGDHATLLNQVVNQHIIEDILRSGVYTPLQ